MIYNIPIPAWTTFEQVIEHATGILSRKPNNIIYDFAIKRANGSEFLTDRLWFSPDQGLRMRGITGHLATVTNQTGHPALNLYEFFDSLKALVDAQQVKTMRLSFDVALDGSQVVTEDGKLAKVTDEVRGFLKEMIDNEDSE